MELKTLKWKECSYTYAQNITIDQGKNKQLPISFLYFSISNEVVILCPTVN